MGYSGFGMQKWIYRQKPRRFFSKDRKPSGDTLEKDKRHFRLKPKVHSKDPLKKFKRILIVVFPILAFVLLGYIFQNYYSEFKSKHSRNNETVINREKKEKQETFSFLLKSGKYYFERKDWPKAIYDFDLALDIDPNHLELNRLYIEASLYQLKTKQKEDQALLNYINKILIIYPNDKELLKLKSEYDLVVENALSQTNKIDK